MPIDALGIAQVTGEVVLGGMPPIASTLALLATDGAVLYAARVAFQRENIISAWR